MKGEIARSAAETADLAGAEAHDDSWSWGEGGAGRRGYVTCRTLNCDDLHSVVGSNAESTAASGTQEKFSALQRFRPVSEVFTPRVGPMPAHDRCDSLPLERTC